MNVESELCPECRASGLGDGSHAVSEVASLSVGSPGGATFKGGGRG